jgi:hypothetical protein
MKPKKADCCVFCPYSDVKCPTAQRNTGGCRGMAARTGAWFVVSAVAPHEAVISCTHDQQIEPLTD